MAYIDDITTKDNHRIGYYVRFDGVTSPRLSTHSEIAGTLPVLIGVPQGSGVSLDRQRSLIMPGGFSCEVASTPETDVLFARNGGTESTLETAVNFTQSTVRLAEGTPYAPGTAVYCEKETIVLGLIVAGTYTGCVRGGTSETQEHAAGAIVSDRPRYWLGRRAQLYAVDLDTGNAAPVRTGMLSASPTYSNGTYQLQFVDMQRELNRKVYTGFQPQKCTIVGPSTINQDDNQFTLSVGRIEEFVTGGNSFVKVSFNDSFAVFEIKKEQVNTADSEVTIVIRSPSGNFLVGYGGAVDSEESALAEFFGTIDPQGSNSELSIQTVGFVRGSPAIIALQIMTSRLGDSVNGFYDVLRGVPVAPGAPGTADRVPKRIGAGLPAAWVDDAAFFDVAEGPTTTILIDEPTSLIDFLEHEIAWLIGGYIYVNGSGQLSFKRYLPAVPAASIDSYTESDVVQQARSVTGDESEIIGSGIIECDYDFATHEYMRKIEVQWQTTYQTYGENRAQLEFSSKALRTADSRTNTNLGNSTVSELQLVTMLDRIYARTRNGVDKIAISVPWRWSSTFVPGYVFKYTDTKLPVGGVRGFTEQQFEVVGVNPNYEAGRVEITAEAQPRGWLVAPSCYVDSYAALTVTIDTTGDEALIFDSDPGLDFIENCKVIIYQAAAVPSFSTKGTGVISATTSNTITFAAPPTVVPAAGDLIVLDASVNTGNVNTTGADVEDHLFCADSSNNPPDILAGAVVGNKWG